MAIDTKKTKKQLTAEIEYLRQKVQDLEQNRADWAQAEELLRIQRGLSTVLGSTGNLQQALNHLLETTFQIDGIDCGGVYLVNPATGELTLTAHKGLSADFIQHTSYYPADSPRAKLVFAGKPIYTDYRKISQSAPEPLKKEGLRALAIFPILHNGQIIAAMNLASHTVTEFSTGTRHILESVATQVGGAIRRTAAENTLRENEQNLQTLFDSLDDFLFILDDQGNILQTNPTVLRRLGYLQDELVNQSILKIHPPERRQEAQVIVKAIIRGDVDMYHVPLFTRDGRQIPVETRVTRGKWGNRPVLFGVSRDMTARHQLRERLEKINACFLSFGPDATENINKLTALAGELLEATCALYNRLESGMLYSTGQWNTPPDYNPLDTPDGHICYDVINRREDNVFVVRHLPQTEYANTDPNVRAYNLQTYVGKAVRHKNEYVGSLCTVFQDDVEPGNQDKTILGILAAAVGVEEARREANEKLKGYRARLQAEVEARTAELTETNHLLRLEISVRERIEATLRASEQKFRTFVTNAPAVIFVLDQDGIFKLSEGLGLAALGLKPGQVVGQSVFEVYKDYPKTLQAIRTALGGTATRNTLHVSGLIFDVSMIPLLDDDGVAQEVVGIALDITERARTEESLRKLSSVVEQIADSVVITDKDGNIEYVNPAFETLTGYTAGNVIGQNPRLLKSGIHTPSFYRDLWGTILAGRTFRSVVINKKRNGELYFEEKTITPIRDKNGEITHFVSTAKDITDRKRAEEKLRQREQFLASLNDITRAALNTPNLQTMLQIIANMLGRLFNADSCYLGLWDEDRKMTLPAAAYGPARHTYRNYAPPPGETTMTASVLAAGHPLVAEDVFNSPYINLSVAQKFPDQSLLGLPLIVNEQKLGAVLIGFKTLHTFTPAEIANAEQAAGQVALAIAKAQLLEETETRWQEAETLRYVGQAITESLSLPERLTRILEQLERVVPYDSASVQLLKHGYMEIVSGRGFENTNEVIGVRFPVSGNTVNAIVATERKPVVFSNVKEQAPSNFKPPREHIESWMGVPLLVQDRMIGMLTVDSRTPGHFSQNHIRLVVPFANQAAIAIENAQLFERARQDAQTKATLLREVNHRVKNNLSAIIGLLYAEQRHIGIENISLYREIMQDLVNRVKGLSLVHSLLSASEWTPLLLSDMAGQLINATLQSLLRGKFVKVEITPSPVKIAAKDANNLALVINELTTNSIKYGLTQADSAHISVDISTHNDYVHLEYQDSGSGYPPDVLAGQRQNVGLYLIQTLVRDGLHGQIVLTNGPGAKTVIKFPNKLDEAAP
ncbi:MAG: PAS domain S-box protein [Chloroflexi bacterium]|nr:MAG: PAS domain S-box protein [Chloroflexota bacterium]